MKFSVGYQLPGDEAFGFMDAVSKYRDHISEVYFPWLDLPTCRAPIRERDGYCDWSVQSILEDDLKALKAMDVKLDILFNANCYGQESISKRLTNRVISIIEHLQ